MVLLINYIIHTHSYPLVRGIQVNGNCFKNIKKYLLYLFNFYPYIHIYLFLLFTYRRMHCPLVPPEKRRLAKREEIRRRRLAEINGSEDDSSSGISNNVAVNQSSICCGTTASSVPVTLDCQMKSIVMNCAPSNTSLASGENQKIRFSGAGCSYTLVDGLSVFFTPANKRHSRVSMNSVSGSLDEMKSLRKNPTTKLVVISPGQSQKARKIFNKSKLFQVYRKRGMKPLVSPPGSAQGERKRGVPVYCHQKQMRQINFLK